jgi:hypothetical protein
MLHFPAIYPLRLRRFDVGIRRSSHRVAHVQLLQTHHVRLRISRANRRDFPPIKKRSVFRISRMNVSQCKQNVYALQMDVKFAALLIHSPFAFLGGFVQENA